MFDFGQQDSEFFEKCAQTAFIYPDPGIEQWRGGRIFDIVISANIFLAYRFRKMNQETLKKLGKVSAPGELEQAIRALCEPFGGLRAIALFPQETRRQYVCYVELNVRSRHEALVEDTGGSACGNSVALTVPFRDEES